MLNVKKENLDNFISIPFKSKQKKKVVNNNKYI